ncbi:MAG TPA: SUMF1/EgtB/PvdO family nonheme iron enzyme [Nitrospiraceae bacterium]|nr:SUMF1/EgtB/PvdO family nonheme iron enzyme [Nitrospiraceae bacterium]
MRKTLVLVALLSFDPDMAMAAASVDDKGAKKFAKAYDFLNQQKYQEARTAYEVGLQDNPSDAMAHFYLGDACRGLKAWVCAEEHYETSLELDAKSSVAGLAKQRGRKAKVWRLLDEGKQAINEPNVSPDRIEQVEDTLDIVNKLGLDDEQQARYRQLREKIQKLNKGSNGEKVAAPFLDQSMVLVPAGEFTMGSLRGDPDEQPVHKVYVGAFFMDKHHVTVSQYARFLEATHHDSPPEWTIMNKPTNRDRPIANVDWAEADDFCRWAGKRLPTEAEWEKAARGTDGRIYPWGNEPPTKFHANSGKEVWSNHSALVPVGTLEGGKSPYGIYDMAGNVWEWVSDWYASDYYASSPSQNPSGPRKGSHKVVRGGAWGSNGITDLRSSDRETHVPSFRGFGTGFRCARTP